MDRIFTHTYFQLLQLMQDAFGSNAAHQANMGNLLNHVSTLADVTTAGYAQTQAQLNQAVASVATEKGLVASLTARILEHRRKCRLVQQRRWYYASDRDKWRLLAVTRANDLFTRTNERDAAITASQHLQAQLVTADALAVTQAQAIVALTTERDNAIAALHQRTLLNQQTSASLDVVTGERNQLSEKLATVREETIEAQVLFNKISQTLN